MLVPAERKRLLAERNSWEDKSRVFRGQGKFAEAIRATQQGMAIERRVFGDVSDEVAKSLEMIGGCQVDLDDFAGARKSFEQMQSILLKLHDKNDWRLVDVRLDLEDVQIHERLTPAARQELALAEQVDGEALLCFRNGEFARGIKLEGQAFEIRRRILGEANVNTANSRLKLATLYSLTGEYAKAEKFSLDALTFSRKVKGNAHPDTAMNLNNLAGLYEAMDEYAKAEPLHLEALSIWTKALGEAHPHVAVCMNDAALLYKSMGQYTKAEQFLKKALKVQKENRGPRHRDTAVTMSNLGELYRDMGDNVKAEPLFVEALGIEKESFGENHPRTGTTINNLATLYTSVGDTAKAEPLLKQAIELHTKGLGEFHPNTAMSYENLGHLYETIHDYVRAESAYRRALAIDQKVMGDNSPKTAEMLTNVAAIERHKGDFAKAETLYRQALDVDKKVVGENHVLTVRTLDGLALVYESQGQFAKAEPLLRQALETSTKIRGEKHPANVMLLNNLAFVYTATGTAEKAEPLSRRALEISEEYFGDSLRGQSERRQLALAHTVRSSLDAYLTYSAQGSAADVYRHVLGWKGAVFMGQLASRAQRHRPDLVPLFEQLEVVSARLSTLAMRGPREKLRVTWEHQVAELSDRKEELERDLSSKSDEFRREKSLLQMDPRELQRALPPGVALIDYLEYDHASMPASGKGLRVHEPRLVAFVVRKDRPIERFELGPIAAVSTAIDAWRKNIQLDLIEPVADSNSARVSGLPDHYLKDRLWKPLRKALAGATTVLVSPDGVLNQIPLAALPGENPGTYLLEELTIVNVPVPRLLPFLLAHPKQPRPVPDDQSMLLVGNVQYGGDPGRPDGVMIASRAAVRGGESG